MGRSQAILQVFSSGLLLVLLTEPIRAQGSGRWPNPYSPSHPSWRVSIGFAVLRQSWHCLPGPIVFVPFPSVMVGEVTSGPPIVPDRDREVATWLRRLPQVPPPDELELLKPVAALPPIRRGPLLALPPEKNPEERSQREMERGKAAFAEGRPGEAVEHFRRAIQETPNRAEAHFLLGQAWLARGRYREAVAALREGLRLKPEWPAADFHPGQLYGRHAADFQEDLAQLERAVQRNPDEPGLRFLLGYQWWFSGRRTEARAQFRQAAALAQDPEPVQAFLRWPE
jgi:hypothetical protein